MNKPFQPLRIWPPLVLLALLFLLRSLPTVVNDPPDWLWMVAVFGPLLCCLLILIWWLAGSRAMGREKLIGLGGILLAVALTIAFIHPTMKGPGMMTLTFPLGFVGFAVAAVLLARKLNRKRVIGIAAVTCVSFLFSLLIRNEGMWGNGAQDFRWRWTPTAEEKMLAAKEKEAGSTNSAPLETEVVDDHTAQPDWPGFRGPHRDGRQRGVPFSGDWTTSPPEELWRVAVGPGWASFAVQGNRLFTQEQRGDAEFLVCYAADSGREVWTSLVGGRFDDPMGGPGPRATPELVDGKLYALSATGVLVCTQANDGSHLWKVNIAEVADREPPMWGFASSPLVTESLVIVHAGGKGDKGTLAFDAASGELKWSAPAGDHSYSSPQRSNLLGEDFVLMLTNHGLRLLEPKTGKVRFFHDSSYSGYRTLQPQLLGENSVLVQASGGPGTHRLTLSKEGGEISAEENWSTTWLKSDFNGCVVFEEHLYGFNGSVLTCLSIDTGERKWRGGRYGKGQLLLLEDSGLLLVITERGEAVLVRATPDKHEELATLQIFEGKAWSHPVVVGDRLYLRNSQEAVCYRLPTQ